MKEVLHGLCCYTYCAYWFACVGGYNLPSPLPLLHGRKEGRQRKTNRFYLDILINLFAEIIYMICVYLMFLPLESLGSLLPHCCNVTFTVCSGDLL